MAVTVVPIPAWLASARERWWMLSLASSMRAASRSCGGPPPSGSPRPSVSTAIREATSPACAPPMPSATTNSGARAYSESSLPRRWRPVSVLWNSSATRSISGPLPLSPILVRELGVSDPDAVAAVQRLGALQQLLVEVRPVRRAEVLDHHDRALPDQPRVARGGEGVLQADLGAVAAAEDRALT